MGHEPFKYPENARSVHQYGDYVARLPMFMIRVMRNATTGTKSIPVLMTDEQKRTTEELDRFLIENKDVARSEESVREQDKKLQACLESILFSRHDRSSVNSTHCPILRFLLVSHIADTNGKFRSAKELCGNISALHFLFRLIFLLWVRRLAEETEGPDGQAYICAKLRARWLCEGEPSPYDSILTIMHYATTVAYAQTPPPSFTISEDRSLVSLGVHHVHVEHLGVMYASLMDEAGGLLSDLTTHLDVDLPSMHWDDNPRERDVNYNFIAQNRDVARPYILAALNRAHGEHFVIRCEADGNVVWRTQSLKGYMASAQKLNTLIMLLIYMSSQPPRVSELTSMLVANDVNSLRSLFWLADGMVAMLSYNKVRAILINIFALSTETQPAHTRRTRQVVPKS